jgi:small subunit ribosomal protein S1
MTNETPDIQPTPEDNPTPAGEPATEPAAEAVEEIAEPPASAPAASAVAASAPQSAPVVEPAGEPATEPAAEPVVEEIAEPPASAPAAPAVAASAPQSAPVVEPAPEPAENFGELLAQFEKTHAHTPRPGQQLQGTVISVSADQVFLDVGFKIEGVLPRSAFENNAEAVKAGDAIPVSVTGRNEEGYYTLTRFKVAQPRDWSALEQAFEQKLAVVGTVTGQVKGGFNVDVGVRAFMPASRSGARDAAEMEALVGQQINCRITKLDVTDEDVVVDRRVVLEEQARSAAEEHFGALKEGAVHTGTVRSLMSYGAFIDIGGVDGLLHVSDMAWNRVNKPDDVVSIGQELEVKILKIDPETKKISLGLKQLQPEPWETAPQRFQLGQRISGRVTRVAEFGAFVELEPGVEGLIHISEMSWGKKIRIASDVVKAGEVVEAVILSIKPEERRISLGLKQTLTDPWTEVTRLYPVGSQVEGPVTKLMNFGAFVQIVDGVEGLVHISEITPARRLNHPSDMLRAGQVVKAQVLAIDTEKRQMKLSMKQLVPTSIDEYLAEHKVGDQVSGRVVEESPALVELGEGIRAVCRLSAAGAKSAPQSAPQPPKADLSSLSSMLQARWKGSGAAPAAKAEPLQVGQVRSFKIAKLDAATKSIEVELA